MGQKIQEFSESATSTFTRAKLQFTSIWTDLYSGRTHYNRAYHFTFKSDLSYSYLGQNISIVSLLN